MFSLVFRVQVVLEFVEFKPVKGTNCFEQPEAFMRGVLGYRVEKFNP